MSKVPDDHPLMVAWNEWKITEDYANSKGWAKHSDSVDGSLWNAFMKGFAAATDRAYSLHENVDPTSNLERSKNIPGADAMGAIIEYRDLIKNKNQSV